MGSGMGEHPEISLFALVLLVVVDDQNPSFVGMEASAGDNLPVQLVAHALEETAD
ncbi:hypothetical protein SDC9_182544 [bioreactor metagenome]|uniref:Uncharacterized protein n=1 Tax=bioreactor metagenome TaxID=1076179 RepID=A0A645H8M6_9ZZZZ